MSATNEKTKRVLDVGFGRHVPVPNGNGDRDHQSESNKRSVVGHYCERIEGQEERADVPKKVKKRDTDNKLDGD